MKFLRKAIVMLGFSLLVGAPVLGFVTPQNTFAAAPTTGADCEKPILGISPWFRGLALVKNGECVIASPGQTLSNGKTLDLAGFIWRIALNIIDIALAAVGYIAFFFVLYGGFQFLTGGSNPGQIEKARTTILNAVIGLVISIGAVAVINLVFGIIG
jgi:hypothetical protein